MITMKTPSILHRLGIAGTAALVAMGLCVEAHAAPIISFAPVTQTVNIGDTAVVAIQISGLTAGTAPALGAWALDIDYNPAIVGIDFLAGNATFGLALRPPLEPLSDQGSNPSLAGTLNLYEIAFADPGVLAGFQGDTFTLATLSFTALAQGVSPLNARILELSNENGVAIAGAQTTPGEIRVGNVVPEPATGMFATALVLAALSERRRKVVA